MKSIVLFFFMTVTICYGQKVHYIKSIKEYSFKDEKTGEILNKSKLHRITYFDSTERRYKEILYDSNQEISRIIIYNYNELGQCILITEFNNYGDTLNVNDVSYDKNGKVIPFLLSSSCEFCKQNNPSIKCEFNKDRYVTDAIKYDEVFREMIIIKYHYEYEYW